MKSISKRVAELIRKVSFKMLFRADRIESLGLSIFIFSTLKNVINRIVYRFRPKSSRGQLGILSTLDNNTSGKNKNNIDGAIFIGYAEGALGLGQSFRSNLEAARSAKFPFAIFPVKKSIETRLIGPFMADRYDIVNGYSINIFEIAVDQIDFVKKEIDLSFKKKSYNILRPYWELSRAPEEWRKLISDFDELWAPNQYISDAFSHVFDKEIIVMPPAVDVVTPYSADRKNLNLEEDKFYFLFSFDYNSSPYRKNPLGVIEAFLAAFVNNEKVGLVIKSNGDSQKFPHIRSYIENAAEKDLRIRVIDGHVDRQKMRDLLNASDVYVSLHRAEGLGLGMVEAMALGRSVIGTNFSGSTDFLNSETGYPIPYRLRSIQDFEYPWSKDQLWAEPDLNSAASTMLYLYHNKDNLDKQRSLARNAIIQKYGPISVGKKMKSRIEHIQKTLN